MGKVLGILVRPARRAAMVPLAEGTLLSNGLEGDHSRGHKMRQVSLLSAESWAAVQAELGLELDWSTRRANFLVEECHFVDSIGKQVQIGECLLEITQETEPCGLMDSYQAGLRQALRPEWRGGVCCKVLRGGVVRPGDEVRCLPR